MIKHLFDNNLFDQWMPDNPFAFASSAAYQAQVNVQHQAEMQRKYNEAVAAADVAQNVHQTQDVIEGECRVIDAEYVMIEEKK